MVASFVESFWTTDFVSSAGFDTLVRRLKDGRKTCKEVEDFLTQRSKIEDEYAKNLLKLARTSIGSLEIGSLSQSIMAVRSQVEATARFHQEMSLSLQDQAFRLLKVGDAQSATRKQLEDNVRKHHESKKSFHTKTSLSQATYHKKCQAFDLAQHTFNQEKGNLVQGTAKEQRELEKLENKMAKAKEEKLKADDAYKNLVKTLEQARVSWEEEFSHSCVEFQRLEEERIDFVRNELWVLINTDSVTCADQDNENEMARQVMEKCDVDSDIQLFIREKGLGSTRPAPIVYECLDKLPTKPPLLHTRPLSGKSSNATFYNESDSSHDEVDPGDPTYAAIALH